MAASYKVAILTNRPGPHVLPVVGVVVDAVDADLIPAGGRFSHDDIVATATTDEAGVATFSGISGSIHWFRARMTESHFVEVLKSTATGVAGCWDAIVRADGTGTDATLQAAIDRLTGGGSILVCGIVDEEVDIPGDNTVWDITGAHNLDSGIRTTAADGIALTINNDNGFFPQVVLRNLRLDATGTGTAVALRLGTGSTPAVGGLRVLDCVIGSTSATHAVRTRDGQTLGLSDTIFSRCTIQSDDDALVVSAGAGSTGRGLDIENCTIESTTGLAYSPSSSTQAGLLMANCSITAGGAQVLRLRSMTRSRIIGNSIVSTVNTGDIITIFIGQNLQISNNSIRRSVGASTGDGIAISIADGLSITGNFFGQGSTHRHAVFVDGGAVTDGGLTVQGNTINDCVTDGIRLVQGTSVDFRRVAIFGNVIQGCGGNGITFDQKTTPNRAMVDVAVTGNTIVDNTSDGIEFLAADDFYDRFCISGNVIASNGGWGIAAVADADVRNSAIVGNTLGNNTSGTIQNLTDANNGKVIQHNA